MTGRRLDYSKIDIGIVMNMLMADMHFHNNELLSSGLIMYQPNLNPYRNMSPSEVTAFHKALWERKECVIDGQTRTRGEILNAYIDARDTLLVLQSDAQAAIKFDAAAMAIILSKAGAPKHAVAWATALYAGATTLSLGTIVAATRTRLDQEYKDTQQFCGF